jgi:hypothetical protein
VKGIEGSRGSEVALWTVPAMDGFLNLLESIWAGEHEKPGPGN